MLFRNFEEQFYLTFIIKIRIFFAKLVKKTPEKQAKLTSFSRHIIWCFFFIFLKKPISYSFWNAGFYL